MQELVAQDKQMLEDWAKERQKSKFWEKIESIAAQNNQSKDLKVRARDLFSEAQPNNNSSPVVLATSDGLKRARNQ